MNFAGLRKFCDLQNLAGCEICFLLATIHASCSLFTFHPCDTVPALCFNFCLFVPLLISSHFFLVTVTALDDFGNFAYLGAYISHLYTL